MIAVIPLIALLHRGAGPRPRATSPWALNRVLPAFARGFVALALVRTLGDRAVEGSGGFLDSASWMAAVRLASEASTACLAVAMAAIGLSTRLDRLRRLGLAPFGAGLATALTVGIVSAVLVHLLARRVLGAP
jgi:uncharacterized membrane protein YadS